jgi:acyl-CoA dehydrogenase
MQIEFSPRSHKFANDLRTFMDEYIYPSESMYAKQLADLSHRWEIPSIIEELKQKARVHELWNLWLPESKYGAGLNNLDYAPLAEIMGRSLIAPEVFNCSVPDTGNMEVLLRYGTEEQKERWLKPLLNGEIRSSFAMTEPDVASSDTTNLECPVVREGDSYLINGHKWWASGAMHPSCKVIILLGKSNTKAAPHLQHSVILIPMQTPGVEVVCPLTVFSYDDAPNGHAEISFENVRVPLENILLGEGRGFEIEQGRLGQTRIHHCMHSIGVAERALELMIKRTGDRVAFGSKLIDKGIIRHWIATSRIEIEQARLLCLKAAHMMDTAGNKAARREIAMIKVVAPNVALNVLDRAMQAHGGAGLSQDFFLAHAWAALRSLRLADGPDELHLESIAKMEVERNQAKNAAHLKGSLVNIPTVQTQLPESDLA